MSAARINAVLAAREIDSAVKSRSFLSEEIPHLLIVKRIPDFFNSTRMSMKAQQIPRADRKRYLAKPFLNLAHSKGGVYAVHLQQKGTSDHVVVIDGELKLISIVQRSIR